MKKAGERPAFFPFSSGLLLVFHLFLAVLLGCLGLLLGLGGFGFGFLFSRPGVLLLLGLHLLLFHLVRLLVLRDGGDARGSENRRDQHRNELLHSHPLL